MERLKTGAELDLEARITVLELALLQSYFVSTSFIHWLSTKLPATSSEVVDTRVWEKRYWADMEAHSGRGELNLVNPNVGVLPWMRLVGRLIQEEQVAREGTCTHSADEIARAIAANIPIEQGADV